MTDRPIIFSAPMIRALLDGRKTQTRRKFELPANSGRMKLSATPNVRECRWQRGDRLWVREAFVRYHDLDECDMRVGPLKIAYRADGGFRWLDADTDEFRDSPPWVSPIYMPRWASRLTLLVTDVRVQRLQEISSADAIAEGCPPYANSATIDCDTPNPRDDFKRLWNSIHGPDAWDANPWVAAISFTVHRCNIDTMEEGTW